jgi:uncharacterized metal-binding protein
MREKVEILVNCARCSRMVCRAGLVDKAPDNCPSRIKQDVIDEATEKCFSPDSRKFAYQASIQEGVGYARLPHAPNVPSPIKSRLEEIIELSKRMGFERLGVAFCSGVKNEAEMLVSILEDRGFEVVSVCCKCGMVPKKELGIKREEQIQPEKEFETMCHPIAQAEILNEAETDFNIVLCLCVGHDALFLRNSKALCTVLAAKDRLFAHNPLAALYLSKSYHRRILAKETVLLAKELAGRL